MEAGLGAAGSAAPGGVLAVQPHSHPGGFHPIGVLMLSSMCAVLSAEQLQCSSLTGSISACNTFVLRRALGGGRSSLPMSCELQAALRPCRRWSAVG